MVVSYGGNAHTLKNADFENGVRLISCPHYIGSAIGLYQWESVHLDRSYCLVCTGEIAVHNIQRGDIRRTENLFLIVMNFGKR